MGKAQAEARQGRQARGHLLVHSGTDPLGACILHYSILAVQYYFPLSYIPTIRLHTAPRHLYHCITLIHSRSSLPSAARHTPITFPPPLSLQITSAHLPSHPSHVALSDQHPRDKPTTVVPRGHVPSSSTNLYVPEETRPLPWTGTLARALPLSCARYGPELLGGRVAHFIRPLQIPTGRGPRRALCYLLE